MRKPTIRNLLFLNLIILACVNSFRIQTAFRVHPPQRAHIVTRRYDTTTTTDPCSSTISLIECDGTPEEIMDAASHMIDCFWLNSPQGLLLSNDDITTKNDDRARLLGHQAQDLTEQFGERLGKRMLDTMLIKAVVVAAGGGDDDTTSTVGMVCAEVRLLDTSNDKILGPAESEQRLKTTVASLGPKQRRQYKDASVQEIAKKLLPSGLVPTVLLSNLSVAPQARRTGLAQRLCQDVERVAQLWGYDELFLKVEAENEAGRSLYENKMNFSEKAVLRNEPAIRVDGGAFVEVEADTLVLSKTL